jgi:hypothetical protein
MCDVPCKAEDVEGRRLFDLLSSFQFFFEAHRSVDDSEAGVALFAMKLPKSGERSLATA